jgi:hypothetical protein
LKLRFTKRAVRQIEEIIDAIAQESWCTSCTLSKRNRRAGLPLRNDTLNWSGNA